MPTAAKRAEGPTIVKKYANRRLYDTGRSSYVTLDDLCEMVKEGHDFIVQDAKTGEDLTRQVLTQIIVDREAKGENMLPVSFMKQLIGFYGDNLQSLVPNYLEQAFEAFSKNQEQFRSQMSKSMESLGGVGQMPGMGMMNPMTTFEEINRQNMALFENLMRTWSPFGADRDDQK
ncbi:MAG: polyhydroxyalkanoate synthesis repressor PhaR [Alphaproteobacteria bacterium]|nr:polyhydroxyalkanoate synthesis repressor PhaR [Alphaproteobacteria bacterium]